MRVINTKEPVILLLTDLAVLCASLWLSLTFRYQEVPATSFFAIHIMPFSIIFGLWVFVFYLAGLYEKHTNILRNKLPLILSNAQLIAGLLAIMCFYVIPFFSITPKTLLVIFTLVSFVLFYVFRIHVYSRAFTVRKEQALIIGAGDDVLNLHMEVNSNKNYALSFVALLSPDSLSESGFESTLRTLLDTKGFSVIVLDPKDKTIEPFLPKLYALLLEEVRFIDLYQVYEDVFDKVPVSLISHSWFIENITVSKKVIYDFLKRTIDIAVGFVGICVTLPLYPFIMLAMRIEGAGPFFITQIRVGKRNRPIRLYKFRSMTHSEDGVWIGETANKITKVGAFLRKSSFDEFPQFLNILRGDISLVGPRPDMTGLEERLSKEIPYYSFRYVVKPGLSGWAQTKQDIIPNSVAENKDRLAYDLYYVKNRTLFLDIKIILKTLKTWVVRGGR